MTETELKLIAARGDHGAQEQAEEGIQHACRDRHAERVVDEGEEQVLSDVRHRDEAELTRADDSDQVTLHQRDAGALHRHVGPGAHRNAHLRGHEGWRIIDPVSRHRHATTFGLELPDDLGLLIRQNVRVHLVDAELPRDRLSRDTVVPGEHHEAQPSSRSAARLGASTT
jgi:hypothetical protein